MKKPKLIVIIDDHPLFREGVKTIIAGDHRFKVIGEAGDGCSGLQEITRLKPDIVMLDISLPDLSGIELTREIRRLSEKIRIIILSMHAKIDYIAEAFQAGANGYIVKEAASDRLLQGLEAVAGGQCFLDSAVSREVVNRLTQFPVKKLHCADSQYGSLTPREQEIMRLIAEGFPTKEVADKLFISPKTAENHRANIMKKLNLHSTLDLVRYAAKLGLIDVDLWKE